jgi:hypothetical protein
MVVMDISEKKQRDRDKRLQKTYRITLETRQKIAAAQNYRCGVCGRHEDEFTVPLQVDHKHFKVQTQRSRHSSLKWTAYTELDGRTHYAYADTQKAAIVRLKDVVLPLSVRGLACPGKYSGCNRLMGRIDKIEWLEKVLNYLRNPPAHKVIDRVPKI